MASSISLAILITVDVSAQVFAIDLCSIAGWDFAFVCVCESQNRCNARASRKIRSRDFSCTVAIEGV